MSIKTTAPLQKNEAAKKEDTEKGAAAMVTVKPNATVKPVSDPLLEKVSKIAELQKKSIHLQRLREMNDELRKFKTSNTESSPDYITIRSGNDRSGQFETSNPFLIAKVLEGVQREVNAKIPLMEAELREASI